MSRRLLNPDPLTIRRAVRWTIVLFPAVSLGLIAAFWLESELSEWLHLGAGRLLLIALEIAYAVGVLAAALGALPFGSLVFLRRRAGRAESLSASAFILCGAVLLAAIAAETACSIWRIRTESRSPTPSGGLPAESLVVSEMRLKRSVIDVPLPTAFVDSPGDRDIDLVVLGDSMAEGWPFHRWLSIGHILSWKIEEAVPRRHVRLSILASIGDTLAQQCIMLKDLDRRPEILVVYCGTTGITMGVPPSRDIPYYFDERPPGVIGVVVDWIERSSPVCGLLHGTQEEFRPRIREFPPHDYELIDEPVYNQIEYIRLLADFRSRLETIISYAERVGAIPILIAPASNDAGFEPNRSFLPASAPRDERQAFAREFREARRTERIDPDRAIGRYRSLLARHAGFAEAHYRLGKLLEGKGEWDEAYEHHVAARDRDGFPVRFLTAYQDVYREVAARHDCILIDIQTYFHMIGRHGLLDDELFQDEMHVSLRGQIALAQAVIHALRARRIFDWPQDSALPYIDPSECAARFKLDPAAWRSVCMWEIKYEDIVARWCSDPSRRGQRRFVFASAADRLEAGETPESLGLPNIGIPSPVPPELSARASMRPAPRSGPKEQACFEIAPHH